MSIFRSSSVVVWFKAEWSVSVEHGRLVQCMSCVGTIPFHYIKMHGHPNNSIFAVYRTLTASCFIGESAWQNVLHER
jgi:hypothetical protein